MNDRKMAPVMRTVTFPVFLHSNTAVNHTHNGSANNELFWEMRNSPMRIPTTAHNVRCALVQFAAHTYSESAVGHYIGVEANCVLAGMAPNGRVSRLLAQGIHNSTHNSASADKIDTTFFDTHLRGDAVYVPCIDTAKGDGLQEIRLRIVDAEGALIPGFGVMETEGDAGAWWCTVNFMWEEEIDPSRLLGSRTETQFR